MKKIEKNAFSIVAHGRNETCSAANSNGTE